MKGAASLERMTFDQDRRISDVVKREQARLRHFIRRRVPDPRDAEDILQDVFYTLVEANRLLMPIEHVTGWLFRVARNRITDFFPRRGPSLSAMSWSGTKTRNRRRWKTCFRRPMPDQRHSTPAACFSMSSKQRSTSFRRSSGTSSWRTSWKGVASKSWRRKPGSV